MLTATYSVGPRVGTITAPLVTCLGAQAPVIAATMPMEVPVTISSTRQVRLIGATIPSAMGATSPTSGAH